MGKKHHQEFGHITVKSIRADTFTNLPATASIDHTDLSILALGADADIPAARVFTPGTGIAVVDGGAGGAYTVSVDSTVATSAPEYILNSADGSLPNSRTLTAGTGIALADGGGGGALTVSTDSTVAPSNSQYILLTGDGALPNARTITAGTNVNFVDGGGGGPLTINVPSGGPDAPNTAQYVTLATDAGLTSERVLQGTDYQVTVTDNTTTVDLSLPTIIAPNAGFVYTSTGTDSDVLVLGDPTLSGVDNKTNSVVLDTNVSALLEKAFVATNSTVAGDVFASLVCGGGSNVFTSATVCSRGIIAGDGVSVTGAGSVQKSLALGAANITATVENSLVFGEGNTISAVIDRSAVMGSNCIASGTMNAGSFLMGEQCDCEGTMNAGNFAMGFRNDVKAGGNMDSGALLLGYLNNILSGGDFDFGSLALGGDINVNSGRWTTDLILGNDIDLDATVQSVGNVVIGSRIDVNEPSNRRVFISGGDAVLPLTSVYSDGVDANRTYFTSTQGNGLHLVGRDELHLASETTRFDDSRPRCDEVAYPTTNADDLVSKAYADAFNLVAPGVAGDWGGAGTPTTILEAINRIANYVAGLHGAIP